MSGERELTAVQKKAVSDAALTIIGIAYDGAEDAGQLMRITLLLVYSTHKVTSTDVLKEIGVRLEGLSPELAARIAKGLGALKPATN